MEASSELRNNLLKVLRAPKKKTTPFSSWAGKRSAPAEEEVLQRYLDEAKRAAFSSWAGKRAAFSSWAGKRADTSLDDYYVEQENDDGSDDRRRIKRESTEADSSEGETMVARERRGVKTPSAFSAWGGKRSDVLQRRFARDAAFGDALFKVMRPHRAAFSAWGG
jgi:hypothetical protein